MADVAEGGKREAAGRKRPAPRRRCVASECTNFARGASPFCAAHKNEPASRQAGQPASGRRADGTHASGSHLAAPASDGETFAERVTREDLAARQAAAGEFRRRLDAGDYRALFGGQIGALMSQAAAEAGVDDEIAILRLVMARLMAEETDVVTLSQAIARIVSVSIQAARVRRVISGQLAEGLTDAVTQILADLGVGDSPL